MSKQEMPGMKCPTSFNTLRQQKLRAVPWRVHVAVQENAGGTRTGQKESVREFLTYRIWTEDASRNTPFEKRKARSEDPSGLSLRNKLSAAYAKRNPRRVDFLRHHRGCRRHRHLGCHHHRRNFGLVRNRSGTAPDSSGPAENKSGARSTSSVLSTSERALDYTRARGVDCTSEPGVDYRSAAAKHRDCCRGTPAYRDCCVAEARKHDHCSNSRDYCCWTTEYRGSTAAEARKRDRRSSSSDDCHCYSEAARCAGQSYSRRNRNGQPRRGDPGGACGLIAGAGSWDDSILRIPSARVPDPLHCPALPKYARYFREAETDCRASSSSACAASFPSKTAAGLARIRAAAHCCPSSNPACAASFSSRKAAGFARDPAAAERFRLHRKKSPGGRCFQRHRGPEHPDPHGDRPPRRHLPDG